MQSDGALQQATFCDGCCEIDERETIQKVNGIINSGVLKQHYNLVESPKPFLLRQKAMIKELQQELARLRNDFTAVCNAYSSAIII